MKPIAIDMDKCTLCGLCIIQCSNNKIILENNRITITNSQTCIGCGHCYAICPQSAILPENREIPEPVKNISLSPENLLYFLRSRRSHRIYTKKSISDKTIQELANFGRFAPTGTNTESVHFLFVKNPDRVKEIQTEIMKFYSTSYRLVNYGAARIFGPIFDRRLRKIPEIRKALKTLITAYKNGQDPIFYRAPLLAFLYADRYEASTPHDDCCYAACNMILGAETMGLSSCINARAIAVLSHNRKLKAKLGFVKGLTPYVCIGFGYPEHRYKNLVFRKEARTRILQ